MVEMELKSVITGGGPIPSVVVLKPATDDETTPEPDVVSDASAKTVARVCAPLDVLPIQIGIFEASAIATGVAGDAKRPLTHDLLDNVIATLGGELDSVSITRVEGTTFYAALDISDEHGAQHHIDARPSDAVALAVRAGVPILASEQVIEQAGSPDFDAIAKDERAKEARAFHDFVEDLTPDDFKAHDQH